jgi:hypothetical protein
MIKKRKEPFMNVTAAKCLALTVLFCVIPALPSGAATISIMIIETGGEETKTGKTAEFWETGMMNALFEAGHIVSNAPSARIPRTDGGELPAEARREFEEAAIGGADYFVVLLLDYKDGNETLEPERIFMSVYKIIAGGLLYSETYANKPFSGESVPDAGRLARTLVSHIRGG